MQLTFSSYIKQLLLVSTAVSLALGLVIALSLLIFGGTTAEIDLTFDFGRFDGLWFLIGLPLVSLLVLILLSPLSYWIYRLLQRPNSEEKSVE